jgi:ubiquinone/menaquinone biosynthesis C-methylase UbiE
MKNVESWKSSKYSFDKNKWRGSRNPRELGYASRLVADLVAQYYKKMLPIHAGGKLLDLGCGKVPLYGAYKDMVVDVTCVDWENSLHKNNHLDVVADLNELLPLEAAQFDTVILSDVLEHIREPQQLVREIFRVLKPGGKLIMNVPYFYWLHEEPYDYYRYTKHALKYMAEKAGLEVLEIESLGGLPEILADLHAKLFMKIPFIGKFMALSLQGLTQLVFSTGFGKKFSVSSARKFPFAYGMVAIKKNI